MNFRLALIASCLVLASCGGSDTEAAPVTTAAPTTTVARTTTTVRPTTTQAPAIKTVRAARNLRVSTSGTSATVTWDAPFPHADEAVVAFYLVCWKRSFEDWPQWESLDWCSSYMLSDSRELVIPNLDPKGRYCQPLFPNVRERSCSRRP